MVLKHTVANSEFAFRMSSVLISRFMFHLHRSPGPAGSMLQETRRQVTSSAGSSPIDSIAFVHFRTDNLGTGIPSAAMASSASIALEDDWDNAASDVEAECESNGEGHPVSDRRDTPCVVAAPNTDIDTGLVCYDE